MRRCNLTSRSVDGGFGMTRTVPPRAQSDGRGGPQDAGVLLSEGVNEFVNELMANQSPRSTMIIPAVPLSARAYSPAHVPGNLAVGHVEFSSLVTRRSAAFLVHPRNSTTVYEKGSSGSVVLDGAPATAPAPPRASSVQVSWRARDSIDGLHALISGWLSTLAAHAVHAVWGPSEIAISSGWEPLGPMAAARGYTRRVTYVS